MEVDVPALVVEVVDSVVDVNAVVLVGDVPLQSMPSVAVHSDLVVHLQTTLLDDGSI